MSDSEAWLFFDGAAPEHLQPLLEAFRELPPSTPEEKEEGARRISEGLDAELARQGELLGAAAALGALGAPVTRAPGDRQVAEDGVTVRSPSFDDRPAAPPPAPPPAPPVEAREPRPPEPRSRIEDLMITSVALDVPAEFREQMGRLPFGPRAPGTELTRTLKVPVLNPLQGQTTPDGDDSIAKARAALPFAPRGAALGQSIPLPLKTYAWLRAELSMWPDRSDEILPRYQVENKAALRALGERWEIYLAASPEARASFEKLLAEYTGWLRSRRG